MENAFRNGTYPEKRLPKLANIRAMGIDPYPHPLQNGRICCKFSRLLKLLAQAETVRQDRTPKK